MRYEVRSASNTSWWRTDDLHKAFSVLRSHGTCSDYVFDTVTGGRPSDPDLDYTPPCGGSYARQAKRTAASQESNT